MIKKRLRVHKKIKQIKLIIIHLFWMNQSKLLTFLKTKQLEITLEIFISILKRHQIRRSVGKISCLVFHLIKMFEKGYQKKEKYF